MIIYPDEKNENEEVEIKKVSALEFDRIINSKSSITRETFNCLSPKQKIDFGRANIKIIG